MINNLIYNYKFKVKSLVWDKYVYYILYNIRNFLKPNIRLKVLNENLILNKKTEIVIEGYPRCANSFFYNVFKVAQKKKINVAHHLHVPFQILQGVKKGIPVVILIREPVDAITSRKIRNPELSINLLIKDYINFYSRLQSIKDKCIVADFEKTIHKPNLIIKEINDFFNKKYNYLNMKKISEVYQNIENINKYFENGDKTKVSLPNKEKDTHKKILTNEIIKHPFIKMAIKLYNSFVNK